jgi:hypothetical protein
MPHIRSHLGESVQNSDVSTPTSNFYGSNNASWTRFATAERWVKGWIPERNIKVAPTSAAGWKTLSATGLALKVSIKPNVYVLGSYTARLLLHTWLNLSPSPLSA